MTPQLKLSLQASVVRLTELAVGMIGWQIDTAVT